MSDGWHLRKEVSWTLIISVVLQLAGFGYLIGQLDTRVTHLEQQQSTTTRALTTIPERLVRLEVILERIETQLSRP